MISLDASLGVQLGQTLDDIRAFLARLARAERQYPRYLEPPFGFSIPATASSLTVADLGGPNQGRIWQVDRFVVDVSPLGSTRPTGITVYLFSGPGQQQGSTQLNPGFFTVGVNDEAAYTAYPAQDKWSSRQFVVQYPEHLLIGVLQPSASPTVHQVAGQAAVTDLVIHEDEPFVEPSF